MLGLSPWMLLWLALTGLAPGSEPITGRMDPSGTGCPCADLHQTLGDGARTRPSGLAGAAQALGRLILEGTHASVPEGWRTATGAGSEGESGTDPEVGLTLSPSARFASSIPSTRRPVTAAGTVLSYRATAPPVGI